MVLDREAMPALGLRDTVKGTVFLPGDAGYDEARMAWNVMVDQSPAVIVEATCVEDVQAAVRYARQHGFPIGVMATGHGLPRGCNGGVLIHMRRMNGVAVDAEKGTMRVQGGAKFMDVFPATQAHGLAPLSGSAPHVGVVGYTLGGGYGLMSRKHGLAVDSVRSAQMVLASGEIVNVSATENPDLFWAIRGGGGAYGVVTEIEMALYPEAMVFGGATIYPADNLEAILDAYTAWTKSLPDEVSSSLQIMNLPPAPFIPEPLRGKCVVNINACVCGGVENAEELVAPMRNLAPAVMDMWGTFPYAESARVYNDPVDPMPVIGKGLLLNDMDETMVRNMLGANGPAHLSPLVAIQIRHLGGQIARVAHEETAIGCRRDAKYLIYTLGVPHPMASPEAIGGHVAAMFDALEGHTVCPGPLNFLGEGTVEAKTIRSLFTGGDYERLREVKTAYDPENAFPYASLGLGA